MFPLRSLRTRLLLPLLAAALLVVLAVTVGSHLLGVQWAKRELAKQTGGVKQVLQSASFPLTDNVLELIAQLTRTELAVFSPRGELLARTFDMAQLEPNPQSLLERPADAEGIAVVARQRSWIAFIVERPMVRGESPTGEKVLILVDEADVAAVRWRATLLPLVTGLSTTLLLGTLTLALTGRLISRLSRLKSRVERVAGGDFASKVSDKTPDEVGNLGDAVDSMAEQLNHLWLAINRRQSERLLHQMSAGLAHELRNSLTGVRMAIELHARSCPDRDDESLGMTSTLLEELEDYVGKLVLVGRGQLNKDQPACVDQCLARVQSRIRPIAEHHHVAVSWPPSGTGAAYQVRDGRTFEAAITNLVMNAVQAARQVQVTAQANKNHDDYHGAMEHLSLRVVDNGPGIAAEIADTLFDPFVTTKPEGMGLGLAHVKRAAEHLEGEISWWRQGNQTIFDLRVRVRPAPQARDSSASRSHE